MSISVHTNTSAMIALQNLNSTNDKLDATQQRISTGLAVNAAKDNASVYAIAQGQRADINSLNAVTMSLNRASSIADVTATAGSNISDLLNEMREKVVSAMDSSISTTSRMALNDDFTALISQIRSTMQNAEFDGANLLNGSLIGGINFLANADATASITLSARDMNFGAGIITLQSTDTILTSTSATAVLSSLDASIRNVNSNLGSLGSQARQIEGHLNFVSKLSDALNQGVGNLVDADMAKESARLQALQVQQQLGVQSLSIANQSPQTILSLFK
jgi:flagellin